MLISGVGGINIPNVPVELATATTTIDIQKLEEGKKDNEKPMTVESFVRSYFSDLPIMAEVARCESTFRHLDAKGKIVRGVVNKGDIGVMQINEGYHGTQAEKLGIDLYTIEGNVAYARALYEKQGLRPWLSSSKCWANNRVAVNSQIEHTIGQSN